MDSEEPDVLAAVVPPHGTSPAFAAAYIRLNGTPISGTDTKLIGLYIRHDSRELVAYHPRVGVDRLASSKSVEVAPTYTHLFYPNQSIVHGRNGHGNFAFRKLSRRLQHNLSHLSRRLIVIGPATLRQLYTNNQGNFNDFELALDSFR